VKMMSSPNIGWLFYKGYYRNVTDDDYLFMLLSKEDRRAREKEEETLEKKISKNVQNVIDVEVSIEDSQNLGNSHFKATTTYPGLLLGTGIDHELPAINNQAILGFTFDYTTGLPIISASSVKGVLRSAFKHADYIQFLLDDETFDVKALELEIFGQDNGAKKVFQGRDIFFDALVVSGGKILGDDYLAPHGNDALKNPVPLRFVKVLPAVTFQFDFELTDGILDKERKTILFAQILSDLGIGAKSNVGYGKFSSDLLSKAKLAIESQKEEERKREEDRVEQERAESEAKALESLDSNIEKIKVQIKEFSKKETKKIYDIVVTYELDADEKKALIEHLHLQIGEKPAPKNQAPVKWAIKIYEFLDEE